jgi:cell division inhibitor SepF
MNLLKKFVRNDNADLNEEYDDDMYVMPEDLRMEMPESDANANVSAINTQAQAAPAAPVSPDRVALKLMQPKSHTEATQIADKLREGCIILLDIGLLPKDKAHRLVDFLAGVVYVLGGEMLKTNKNTIVAAPAGVDISGFAPEETPAPVAAEPEVYEEQYENASEFVDSEV